MTPADEKLCRDIAEAKGWPWRTQDVINYRNKFFYKYQNPHTKRWVRDDNLPFLTDPAETLRMLEALTKYYDDSVEFSTNSMAGIVLTCERFKDPPASIHIEEAKSIPHAIATVYLVMLVETR